MPDHPRAEGVIQLWPVNERTRPVFAAPSFFPFVVSPELLDRCPMLAVSAARVAGIPAVCYVYFGINRDTAASALEALEAFVTTRARLFTRQRFLTTYGLTVDPVFRVEALSDAAIAAMIGVDSDGASLEAWATQVERLVAEVRGDDEG